jgi:hypothetical protein
MNDVSESETTSFMTSVDVRGSFGSPARTRPAHKAMSKSLVLPSIPYSSHGSPSRVRKRPTHRLSTGRASRGLTVRTDEQFTHEKNERTSLYQTYRQFYNSARPSPMKHKKDSMYMSYIKACERRRLSPKSLGYVRIRKE